MTGSRRFLLIAVGVCSGAGCLFPSLADLSGLDASVGSDASDVRVTSDANEASASDASDAGDAAHGRFCDDYADATFCEDFDEPDGNYVSRWTSVSLGAGNTVTLEGDATTSAPNALYAEIPANNTGGASLWKDLPPTATHYDYAFTASSRTTRAAASSSSTRSRSTPSTRRLRTPSIASRKKPRARTSTRTSVYYADGGNGVSDLPFATSLVAGQWYHVDVQLDVGPPAKVTVYVEGSPVLATTIPEATNGPGTSEFLAGISHTYTPTGTWRVEVDDVVMRAK